MATATWGKGIGSGGGSFGHGHGKASSGVSGGVSRGMRSSMRFRRNRIKWLPSAKTRNTNRRKNCSIGRPRYFFFGEGWESGSVPAMDSRIVVSAWTFFRR